MYQKIVDIAAIVIAIALLIWLVLTLGCSFEGKGFVAEPQRDLILASQPAIVRVDTPNVVIQGTAWAAVIVAAICFVFVMALRHRSTGVPGEPFPFPT